MSLPTPHRRRASKGDVAARVAVVAGLAAAVGLLMAGDRWESHAMVDATIPCASPAFAPLAAS